ncbi:MAG: immunity 8 family protein [Ruminococcus sp.]|nr:immunity 8 family protein [Ruminococcus sp.]MCM1480450.1 immunity 8 family protein [Muribaculaceae bacterium]
MKVKKIEFPTGWDNSINDNIDVFVTLEDNRSYCVTVCTIKWLEDEVGKFGYKIPGIDIVISEFSYEIVEKAINDYSREDAYWLRLYSVSGGQQIPN